MTSASVMNDRPIWERDGHSWPNRDCSRFVEAGGLRWHIQEAGSGPPLLLIHGTGAASHSWGGLLPLLAERYQVLALDLPGHGFTSAPAPKQLSLPGMATAVGALTKQLGFAPEIVVGHSAGAAILARLCLDGSIQPKLLISLSGALLPLRGFAGKWFSPAAKLFARSSIVPRFFAQGARKDPRSVKRMVDGTGSRLSPEEVALYRLLIAYPGHLAAALNMMANWDLEPMLRELPQLRPTLVLVGFAEDRTVPPSEAERAQRLLPSARLRRLPGLGHLGHEESPSVVFDLIVREAGALP
ncbi:alpha/beta fold hydrolase BchO [Halochromatium salexigens]|uniref:Alpha/beta hydrolase n=1 Tax=Halochromatium salexigens TaxID=49447 RepID=A0AAJ0XH28_HALSE|nr:alpha/beta fold hydrolase BchO [Halochromatium salexigens]MBK5931621.1 alpha/beta hydrolase [Halochromatium salexigens]